jgi:hypothetical protein
MMYFNLKIYIPVDFNILYVYIYFSIFFETSKLKILKFEKGKKAGLHVARATFDVFGA